MNNKTYTYVEVTSLVAVATKETNTAIQQATDIIGDVSAVTSAKIYGTSSEAVTKSADYRTVRLMIMCVFMLALLVIISIFGLSYLWMTLVIVALAAGRSL